MASADPDDVEVMTPLSRLLLERMAERDWQLRDVVRPPDGVREGGPARSTFSHYLQPNGWLRTMPRPKAIEEIATAVHHSASKWNNCTSFNRVYPHGVGRRHAHDHTSGTPVTSFLRSNRKYHKAMVHNPDLDRDRDHIACEKA